MLKLEEFEEDYRRVTIKWHRPVSLDNAYEKLENLNNKNIFLYKLVGKRGEKYKLIYIGMANKQFVHHRLRNGDHQFKQDYLRCINAGWKLCVSVGEFILDEDYKNDFIWAKKNVKTIEKLLIIGHVGFKSLSNEKEVNWFSTGAWIHLINSGFREDGMYKLINYGIAIKP
jgi:hypothetical protein